MQAADTSTESKSWGHGFGWPKTFRAIEVRAMHAKPAMASSAEDRGQLWTRTTLEEQHDSPSLQMRGRIARARG